MIIILGAMPDEVAGLQHRMSITQVRPLFRQSLWEPGELKTAQVHYGTLCGQKVAVTAAGVGKAQAAVTAGVLLDRHQDSVTQLIFMGVAGGLRPEIEIGDLVVGDGTIQHDVDATALNGLGFNLERGQIPFTPSPVIECDPALVEIAMSFAPENGRKIHKGRILSGDQFLNGPLRRKLGYIEELNGAAIEMEGAAVSVPAKAYGVRHVVIRTISDKADDTGPANFTEFMQTVAVNNTVGMVEHILRQLN